MSSSEDIQGNAWPGFVDILSATVMMFMFFVLITAVALFFHVITFTSREDPVSAEEIEEVRQQVVVLEEENQELRKKISGLNQKSLEIDAQFAETDGDQRFSISDDGLTLLIFFGSNSITVTEDTANEVKAFIERAMAAHGPKLAVNIRSPKSRSNIDTVARKVAIARILNTRNGILKTELPRDAISFEVVAPEVVEDERDWSMIQIRTGR